MRVIASFRARTPGSCRLARRAGKVLPGGDTRSGTFFLPYPVFMEQGGGYWLHDVDGHRYVDFMGNYTSLVHGHAHPEIRKAVEAQAARGTALGTPCRLQVELAERIVRRVASIERVRFTNSGSEAVAWAIRAARAHTGRTRVFKFIGAYHGSAEAVSYGVQPPEPGALTTFGSPDGPGIPLTAGAETLVAPYNDLEAALAVISRFRHEIAAVIVEPVLARTGMVPAEPAFLAGLRAATRRTGIVLIFDEVVTFRLAFGGMQEVYGVEPDLTALGKSIGGGLPVGAFGGAKRLMRGFDPHLRTAMHHAGTFNGNALTMAAGIASLDLLTPAEIARINTLGDGLRARFQAVLADARADASVGGYGSLLQIRAGLRPAPSHADGARAQRWLVAPLHLALSCEGLVCAPRGLFALSTPMDGAVMKEAAGAFARAVSAVGPLARAWRDAEK